MNGLIFKYTGNPQHLLARIGQALITAPVGVIVQMFLPRRSNEQNAKMWAMLGDLARAKPQGRSLRPDHWKCLFMDDLGHKPDWQPSLDGESVVNVGYKSSRLTKAQMSDMIERMYAYGAEHEVEWSEPAQGIEAASAGETREAGLDAQHESPVAAGDAPKPPEGKQHDRTRP